MVTSPNNTDQAMAYLRYQHASGSRSWYRKCLVLQRSARGIAALHPTALAAAEATPEKDRVYDIDKVRRGMVLYFDDPGDNNPAGHIVGTPGRNPNGDVLAWSNDTKYTGGVDLVRASFFPAHWGDGFLFAATSLNGVTLDLSVKKKPAPAKPDVGRRAPNFDAIEKAFEAAIEVHSKRGHNALVAELRRELERLRQTRKEHS